MQLMHHDSAQAASASITVQDFISCVDEQQSAQDERDRTKLMRLGTRQLLNCSCFLPELVDLGVLAS